MIAGTLTLIGAATAATPGTPGYAAPAVSVDLARPTVDARAGVVVEDARAVTGLSASVLIGHAHLPLVWQPEGAETIAIVRGATSAWMTAAWGHGPLRIGVALPAYLVVTSDLQAPRGTGLGDASIDLKLSLPRAADRVAGAALIGRVIAPTGDPSIQVGATGWSAEAGAAADAMAGRWGAGVNLVARLSPATDLGGVTVGGGGVWRAAASYRLTDPVHLQAELFGQQVWTELMRFSAPSAAEFLLGARARLPTGALVRGGLGAGLGGAPGAPLWRLMVGIGHPGALAAPALASE
jgi:hypothetical protein